MSPLYAFRFDHQAVRQQRDILMVFVAARQIDTNAFATLVEDEIQSSLVPDEMLIVVRDPSFDAAKEALQQSLSEATLARLGDRCSVTMIGYDQLGKESQRNLIKGPQAPKKIEFSDFQRRAMTSIFASRGGFVESSPTYHFQNPSGRHTERFIRLSNILVRGAEIAFIGFCTLPFIPAGTKVAYLDTPSLYAVVAAINDQLSSFADSGSAILADNFRSYGGLQNYQFDQQAESVALISASSSGGMATDLIDRFNFDKSRVVHLLYLGKPNPTLNAICDLKFHREKNPNGYDSLPAVEESGHCRMCDAGSVAIKLQGDQFDIAGPQPDALLIKKEDAPKGLSDLMERLGKGQILSVGLGVPGSGQPRQFTVDETKLLTAPLFRERLDYVLRRTVPAKLSHVIPIDGHSHELAGKMVACVADVGGTAQFITPDKLNDIPAGTNGAIAIVAAVIESGRSLLDISRDLRSVAPKAPLIYFVGCSKTSGMKGRQSLESTLVQTDLPLKHQFVAVETIILPPSELRNAWWTELQLLQDPDFEKQIPAALKALFETRIDCLRKASQPLVDNLFLPSDPDPNRWLKLQPGFVFWTEDTAKPGHSQADVFFTIASVLQQLRANAEYLNKPAAIRTGWFQQTILAPGNFGRFNDDIIQASLLRAASPFEMNYSNSVTESRELGRLIRRVLEAAALPRGGAAAEFLLAISMRRLQLRKADREIIFQTTVIGATIASFLLDFCKWQESQGIFK